tara:strand:+ start:764 stop:958 length:195 start_codon:yes stop_codon:yes gene_type:complete
MKTREGWMFLLLFLKKVLKKAKKELIGCFIIKLKVVKLASGKCLAAPQKKIRKYLLNIEKYLVR